MPLRPNLVRIGLVLIGLAGALLSSGCATRTADESTIPWSRPAPWEGGIPGMGGIGSPGSQGNGY